MLIPGFETQDVNMVDFPFNSYGLCVQIIDDAIYFTGEIE